MLDYNLTSRSAWFSWAVRIKGILLSPKRFYHKGLRNLSLVLTAIRDLLFTYFNIPYTPRPRIPEISNTLLCIIALSVKHICGKKHINCHSDEAIVVCTMKDGEEYIKTFVEHYLSLGFKHVVFLDNYSSDKSIKIASHYENVTVLQTKLPFRTYARYFKSYLVKRFSRNCWCLSVDVDEFFDYPFSNRVSLKSLLTYLNRNSYNAVLAYMLEMFSDKSLDTLEKCNNLNIKEEYRFYDLAGLEKKPISGPVNLADENLWIYKAGGIRATVFDWARGSLSKYPLIFLSKDFMATNITLHEVFKGARIADFTAILFHYKFTKSFRNRCIRAIEEKNYSNDSERYKQFYKMLIRYPKLNLKQEAENPCEFKQINELVENEFLYVSDTFKKFAVLDNSQIFFCNQFASTRNSSNQMLD